MRRRKTPRRIYSLAELRVGQTVAIVGPEQRHIGVVHADMTIGLTHVSEWLPPVRRGHYQWFILTEAAR